MPKSQTLSNTVFSSKIIQWHKHHGRHDLPWQQQPNAYKVWLSEIMLQQTQVVTVIGYYDRFLNTFPTLQSLAKASIDDVLALWSGLGYYARARNLHKTAKIIWHEYNGEFPADIELIQALPGIGRSTAGAILTFALNQPHPILDGNVKRVLARHFEIEGWYGTAKTLKELWELSEKLTPKTQTAIFNQAMMDMGATVCTRSKPKCQDCCLNETCLAYKNNNWKDYPNAKPKKKNPLKEAYLVMLKHDNSIYFEKRPPTGIWGGLWSFPEFTSEQNAIDWIRQQSDEFDNHSLTITKNALLHKFSHYDFLIHLVTYDTNQINYQVNEKDTSFFNNEEQLKIGLPTPIKKLLR